MIISQGHGRRLPSVLLSAIRQDFYAKRVAWRQPLLRCARPRAASVNEARCSNELLEHLEHLHETNDLFGNVAKSQGQCPEILNGPQCRDTETRRGCSETETVSVETRSRLSSAFRDGPTTVNVISSSRLAEASRE